MSASYELVARVGKARGLEGEVTVQIAGDLPFCLYEGLEVHVVPPTLYGPRDIRIASVDELASGQLVLSFEGVDSIDAAEQIAGRWLLAAVDDLDLDDDPNWFIGCAVTDERYGDLGQVTELIETPANDVIVVDGPYGEVLVPVIDEVIVEVPQQDGNPIVTHVMDGLIDAAPLHHAKDTRGEDV